MKLDVSDKKVLVFLAIIVVLLVVNIFLMMQPKKDDTVSMYKAFAQQTHSSIQQLKVDSAKLSENLVETPDMNSEERELLALGKEFVVSAKKDVDWVAEKENSVYWQIVATQNPLQANELMRKEMALLVLSNYIFALDNAALSDGTEGFLDRADTIEEANAAAGWIQVTNLLDDEIAQEMISQTALQKEDIINESKELMNEYLELRKKAFSDAVKGTNSEFVEAVKLLELNYLLEVNAINQTEQ